jgi:hypothetical protein
MFIRRAFFQNNQDLIDWTNSQQLLHPMYCLGDGHAEFGTYLKKLETMNTDKKS